MTDMSVNLIKVLLFDDHMNYILLCKDEGVLSPFGGQVNRADSLSASVKSIMAPFTQIPPINQPVWRHIRTEEFGTDIRIHIFYGKITIEELMKIEKMGHSTVVDLSSPLSKSPRPIAHRLRYLVPMAIVFDAVEPRFWPKP